VTASTAVIVHAGEGGRRLVQTADSLLRQRVRAGSIVLIKSAGSQATPLLSGVASRLGALVLDASPYSGLTLNQAVRRAESTFFIVLPAGFSLDVAFIERCEMAFREPSVAAVATSILCRTADGTGALVWTPGLSSAPALLSDTRAVPPVFAVRREVWNSLGGFDETISGLVEYEFWLRLASAGGRITVIHPALVARELAPESSDISDERRVEYFQAVLDRHVAVAERHMREVLIEREIRFGQLRSRHRELLEHRDRELAELDRLRSDAAHHRAYLQHHHRDAFDWGDFRRTDPVSREWGYDRGVPVDRRYIEEFLCACSSDVSGSVLEVQEDDFTVAFGGPRVSRHDVLDIDPSNSRATVLADLRAASEIPPATYDCIILTQTLHVIDDMRAALRECHRILKPGGVLLATFPSASRVCLEYGEDGDYWRMTPAGARALVGSSFERSILSSKAYGNVLTNTAFLHGLSATELSVTEFDDHDPYFPVLTGIRAKKTCAPSRAGARGAILLYHRIDATPDVHGLGVPPETFEAHLQCLCSDCQVLSLDDLLSTRMEDLPERAVALTFDDGYEDNLTIAAPLLQRYRVPATFFLTTCGVARPLEYWWDTLERMLLESSTPATLDMHSTGIPLIFQTTTADQRRVAYWRLYEMLVHASLEARTRAIQRLSEWAGGGTPRVRPIVADEVLQLANLPGVAIGAHTVNHVALPDNADSRLLEMNDCRAELRRITGRSIELFAYPYGAVDRETAAVTRRVWRWGLSCDERALGDAFDAARVPRLEVKATSREEFAGRLSRLFEAETLPRGV